MTQQEKYTSASREFLLNAREALAEGDLTRASEKGWDAAAQMVKVIAEQRGWPHNGVRYVYETVNKLLKETGDGEIGTLFHVAGSLRSNSYENWLPADMVQSGLGCVDKLIEKLKLLLA